jgi:hypothetical protein
MTGIRYCWVLIFLHFLLQACSSNTEKTLPLYSDVDTTRFSKGDTVYPFSYINPQEKGWRIVIEVAGDDLNNLSTKVPGRRLSTSRPNVLKLVRDWKFIYNEADLASVTSTILVYRKGRLVDQQGIVLDSNSVGLQSIKFGWISPADDDEIYRVIDLMDQNNF